MNKYLAVLWDFASSGQQARSSYQLEGQDARGQWMPGGVRGSRC